MDGWMEGRTDGRTHGRTDFTMIDHPDRRDNGYTDSRSCNTRQTMTILKSHWPTIPLDVLFWTNEVHILINDICSHDVMCKRLHG